MGTALHRVPYFPEMEVQLMTVARSGAASSCRQSYLAQVLRGSFRGQMFHYLKTSRAVSMRTVWAGPRDYSRGRAKGA